jgi:hypothetical protein
MYGKRRIVLETKPYHFHRSLIVLAGSDSPGTGGSYIPVGYWHRNGNVFHAELTKGNLKDGAAIICDSKAKLRAVVMTRIENGNIWA